jgi:hypothetical protein
MNYDNDDLEVCRKQRDLAQRRANDALDTLRRLAGFDGDHHKSYAIDQAVRALTGDRYDQWVAEYQAGEDGPHTYTWNKGIAP